MRGYGGRVTGIENIRMAAIQLQTSAPVLVHRFGVDLKPFETWDEVEAYVLALRAEQGKTWGTGVVVFSCIGVRAGGAVRPIGTPQPVFAVAEFVGDGVKWTLAPPGAVEPVFVTGQLAGWTMGPE